MPDYGDNPLTREQNTPNNTDAIFVGTLMYRAFVAHSNPFFLNTMHFVRSLFGR